MTRTSSETLSDDCIYQLPKPWYLIYLSIPVGCVTIQTLFLCGHKEGKLTSVETFCIITLFTFVFFFFFTATKHQEENTPWSVTPPVRRNRVVYYLIVFRRKTFSPVWDLFIFPPLCVWSPNGILIKWQVWHLLKVKPSGKCFSRQ